MPGFAQDPNRPFRELQWEATLASYTSLRRTLLPIACLGVVVWLVQWWLAPDWLVDSRSDVDTLLTALPGATIALLALVVAGLLVTVQVAAATYRYLGVWVIARDQRIWGYIYFLAGLGIVALLLAGLAPHHGAPPDALSAALATLVIFFVLSLLFIGQVLRTRLAEYTEPRVFAQLTGGPARQAAAKGKWQVFDAHLVELCLLLSYALQQRDTRAAEAALQMLRDLLETYLEAGDPRADGVAIGRRLENELVGAGDEWVALGLGSQGVSEIPNWLYSSARIAALKGDGTVAGHLVNGLGRLATSSWRMATEGLYVEKDPSNLLTPAEGLADIASRARDDTDPVAAAALECWAFAVVYLHRTSRAAPQDASRTEIADKAIADSARALRFTPAWQTTLDGLNARAWRFRWSIAWWDDAVKLLEGLASAAELEPERPTAEVVEEILADRLESG